MKIMASTPINSWQIDGEIMKTVRDFIVLGSKITAVGDCSLEIKTLVLANTRGGFKVKPKNLTVSTRKDRAAGSRT